MEGHEDSAEKDRWPLDKLEDTLSKGQKGGPGEKLLEKLEPKVVAIWKNKRVRKGMD